MPRRPTLKDAIAATEAESSNDNSFFETDRLPDAPAEERRGVLVRVSADVRRKLKLAAINRGVTVQDLMLEAIASILEEPHQSPAP
jgi:hypothetical protein